jgi:hypothetical protein
MRNYSDLPNANGSDHQPHRDTKIPPWAAFGALTKLADL